MKKSSWKGKLDVIKQTIKTTMKESKQEMERHIQDRFDQMELILRNMQEEYKRQG